MIVVLFILIIIIFILMKFFLGNFVDKILYFDILYVFNE